MNNLTDIYQELVKKTSLDEIIRRNLALMDIFSETDKTVVLGEFKRWKSACDMAGQMLPPSEFKKGCLSE